MLFCEILEDINNIKIPAYEGINFLDIQELKRHEKRYNKQRSFVQEIRKESNKLSIRINGLDRNNYDFSNPQ